MDIFSGGFFSSKSKAPHQHMDYKPNPIRHPKNEGTMKVMYKVMIWTLFVPILSLMLIFILLLVRRYLRLSRQNQATNDTMMMPLNQQENHAGNESKLGNVFRSFARSAKEDLEMAKNRVQTFSTDSQRTRYAQLKTSESLENRSVVTKLGEVQV